MKNFIKSFLLLLLPMVLMFQACDKEIADTTAATDQKNVAADAGTSTVSIVAGSTEGYKDGPALQAQFTNIRDLAAGKDGSIYIIDETRIRKLKDGVVSTVAGTGQVGDKDGPANTALFSSITSIAVAEDGTLYVTDFGNNSIRKITTNGTVSTFAGGKDKKGYADGPLASAKFSLLRAIAISTNGVIYVTDDNGLRRITTAGIVSTPERILNMLGPRRRFQDLTVTPDGTLYLVVTKNPLLQLIKITPKGIKTQIYSDEDFYFIKNITAKADGTLYATAQLLGQILQFDTQTSSFTVIAGRGYDTEGPEEGAALEVAFKVFGGLDLYNNALYVTDCLKIKKITLP